MPRRIPSTGNHQKFVRHQQAEHSRAASNENKTESDSRGASLAGSNSRDASPIWGHFGLATRCKMSQGGRGAGGRCAQALGGMRANAVVAAELASSRSMQGKDCQSNRLETDSSDAVRPMASPIRAAIEIVRMFAALRTASVGWIESVITSSFSLEEVMRATAPPDRTPW